MAAAKSRKIDKRTLRSLEPLGSLSPDKLNELAEKSSVEDIPAGRVLFRQGERDKRVIYLLSGSVELTITGNPSGEIVKAKTVEAKHPLAHTVPRPSNAKTKTACTLLFIDSDLLEILTEDEHSGLIEVEELGADDDSIWMLRFLQSRAFLKLPTENIQTLLMKLEEFPVSKGETIIQQGDTNDYYYIVQKGQCSVSRRPAPNSQDVQLAILKTGDGFGEEALITGGIRNANITMLEDGVLMRLGKDDFMEYLAEPLISYTDESTALDKANTGSLLIDVRRHDEFMQSHVEGSINIPLSMLRVKVEGLNKEREYILVCDDGSRSAAGAFLLTQHGLNCVVLKDGLNNSNLKLPTPDFSVPVAKPAENRKTIAAKKTQQAAEAKAEEIQQEAKSAKQEASKLAKKAAEVEAAKRKADAEIKRHQEEEVAKREAALTATRQRLKEESERAKQAEEKAAKLKLEAKAAKRKAEEELNKLKAESDAIAQRQTDLDGALQHAKSVAKEAASEAEKARKEAEKEANEIRQKAHQEAQLLRKEMEEARLKLEAEAQQKHQSQARKYKAEMDEARKQALDEAEKIRRAARQDAEQLRSEIESARQEVEANAAKLAAREKQQLLEEAQRKAEELVQLKKVEAEQEAERIRQEALEIEAHAVKLAAQEKQQLLEEAQRKAEELARLRTLEAEQEAERIRQEALEEAERLREEITSARQLLNDQVAQARVKTEQYEQENARKKAASAEKVRRHKEELARKQLAQEQAEQRRAEQAERERHEQEIAKQQEAEQTRRATEERKKKQASHLLKKKKAEDMRRKAEAIKKRLEKAEQARQEEEARNKADGMSLADATVRRVGNRIILEGDQDIFIFKEPTVTPEELEMEPEPVKEAQEKPEEKKELPSFNIETPVEEDYVPIARTELTETLIRHKEEKSSYQKQRNGRIVAIAASVILTVGVVGTMFILKQDDKTPIVASKQKERTIQKASLPNPTPKLPTYSTEQLKQVKELKQQAQRRFDKQLKSWKNKVAIKATTPTASPEPATISPANETPEKSAEMGNNNDPMPNALPAINNLSPSESDTITPTEAVPASSTGVDNTEDTMPVLEETAVTESATPANSELPDGPVPPVSEIIGQSESVAFTDSAQSEQINIDENNAFSFESDPAPIQEEE